MKKIAQNTLLVVLTLLATACANNVTKPVTAPAPPQAKCDCATGAPVQVPAGSKPAEATAEQQKQMAKLPDYSLLQTADWNDIDGLQVDNLSLAWPAWMQSCSTLVNKPMWKNACSAAQKLNADTAITTPKIPPLTLQASRKHRRC